MAILYALVARATVVLAEFSAASGNIGAVARRILEKLPSESDSRLCFSQDRYIFHILRSDGITFLCMANDTFGRRVPFSYLEDIHMRFMKNYGKVAQYALAYAMNDEFSRVLHQQMEYFSSNPSADTLNRVRGEVSEGIVDRFDSSVDIHNNCCLLWGHHPSVLQILICSHGYTFLQGDPLLGFENCMSIIIGASCLCYSGHLLHGSQILKPQNVRIGLLSMEDIPVCCIWMLLQFCYTPYYMLSAFHVKRGFSV